LILLLLYHFLFLSFFPWVPQSSSTVTSMFYIWVCIWSCLFLCICLTLDLSFTYERKDVAFVLLHLTWCPPIASITFKLHVIVPYGWVINTPLCKYTTVSWSIQQLLGTWVVSKAWLLWVVLRWTWVCRCLHCTLCTLLWVDAQERYHWIVWQFYL
jgi:hypothetical protein